MPRVEVVYWKCNMCSELFTVEKGKYDYVRCPKCSTVEIRPAEPKVFLKGPLMDDVKLSLQGTDWAGVSTTDSSDYVDKLNETLEDVDSDDVCKECDGEGQVTYGGISSQDDGVETVPCPECTGDMEDEAYERHRDEERDFGIERDNT